METKTDIDEAVLTKAMLEQELDKRILLAVGKALNGVEPYWGDGEATLDDAEHFLRTQMGMWLHDELERRVHVHIQY